MVLDLSKLLLRGAAKNLKLTRGQEQFLVDWLQLVDEIHRNTAIKNQIVSLKGQLTKNERRIKELQRLADLAWRKV
jgi:hypothetical protein